jgi:hypothetical protein
MAQVLQQVLAKLLQLRLPLGQDRHVSRLRAALSSLQSRVGDKPNLAIFRKRWRFAPKPSFQEAKIGGIQVYCDRLVRLPFCYHLADYGFDGKVFALDLLAKDTRSKSSGQFNGRLAHFAKVLLLAVFEIGGRLPERI